MKIVVTSKAPMRQRPEIVERKGRGHPDTLTDGLAEFLSSNYCRFTRREFGEVLHHNFDKVGLLGGKSVVEFGQGTIVRPIRVLLNGRAAAQWKGRAIPVENLLKEWAMEFLKRELPLLEPSRDIEFHNNLSDANTAGYPSDDFGPSTDAPALQRESMLSSDTAALCAYYPLSLLENAVLAVEQELTSAAFQTDRPWLGSDIKVLAIRHESFVDVTACIPQIASATPSADAYGQNLAGIREVITARLEQLLPRHNIELSVNTKDDPAKGSYYLTAIGSCIESGDEGMVGRGNRPNGLIPVDRPFSGEAACGKNPMFFPGKLYNVIAAAAAKRLHEISHTPVEVWLVAQEGRSLKEPWQAIVSFEGERLSDAEVRDILNGELARIGDWAELLVQGKVALC